MDDILSIFIESSYAKLQEYEKKGRYFHILTPKDNSPIVVHKRTNQLSYVISGNGTVVLNGKKKQINTGDSIFVEAGMTHQFSAESNELLLFHIHIPDEGRDNDRYIVEGDDYNRYE